MRGDGIRRRKDRANAWYINWIDALGSRHWKRASIQSYRGAKTQLAHELQKVREEVATGRSSITFKDAAAEYLKFQKARLRSDTEYARQYGILEVHLHKWFRGRLAEVTRRKIQDYVSYRSGKVLPGTVAKEIGTLKRLLNFALDREWLAANPALRVKLPAVNNSRIRYLQPTELQAVLDNLKGRIRSITALAAYTGMRRSEICNLRWLDLDLINRRILIPQTKAGGGRVVHLNEAAMSVLRELPLEGHAEPVDRIFGALNPDDVSVGFAGACRKLNIPDMHFHDLRHTFATLMRQSGAQLDSIAKALGHRDLRMVKRYAHLEDAHVREDVNRLDSVLSALGVPVTRDARKEKPVTRVQ